MSIATIKKVKFDGARCPFSTFLRLQGDHHSACARKWRHFSFFSKSFQTKKKIKALRPKMTKIASGGGGPALNPVFCAVGSRPVFNAHFCIQALHSGAVVPSVRTPMLMMLLRKPRWPPPTAHRNTVFCLITLRWHSSTCPCFAVLFVGFACAVACALFISYYLSHSLSFIASIILACWSLPHFWSGLVSYFMLNVFSVSFPGFLFFFLLFYS